MNFPPDIEEPDLMASVAKNLAKGRRFHFFYAQGFVEDHTKLERGIFSNLKQSEIDHIRKTKLISITPLDHIKHKHFLTGNSIAIYEFHLKNGTNVNLDVVGFDEIVLPNERRGSLWQRQLDSRAKTILAAFKEIDRSNTNGDMLSLFNQYNIEIKVIPNNLQEDLNKAFEIRRDVFIKEQNVAEEEEFDDLDKNAIHLLGYVNQEPIATLRIVEHSSTIQIGRVSVLLAYRGMGVGKKLMIEALNFIDKKNKKKEIFLESQLEKIRFYERFGFEAVGENFFDARMPHRKMIRKHIMKL